jgi:hypothetical protein
MRSSWWNGRIATWTAIPFYLALGCGSPDEDAEGTRLRTDPIPASEMADGAPSGEPAADADASAATGRVMRAELEALGGTDVVGTVSLSPGPGGTTVAVEIHGANSGLPYVAELVVGSCQSPGAVIAELGRVTAGETGDGEFREVLDPTLLQSERASRAVQVRGAGDSTAIVACGNLGAAAP